MHRILSLFLLSILSTPVMAEKIKGVGISQSAAGTDFNYSIASSNAMTFLVDQITQSFFQFRQNNNNFTITRTLKGKVGKITNKEVIYLPGNGVAVILETDAKMPDYPDATCYKHKYKIRSAKDLSKMMPDMLKSSVLKLAKEKYKSRSQLNGVAYVKELDIYKWRSKGKYTIRSSVCLAEVK